MKEEIPILTSSCFWHRGFGHNFGHDFGHTFGHDFGHNFAPERQHRGMVGRELPPLAELLSLNVYCVPKNMCMNNDGIFGTKGSIPSPAWTMNVTLGTELTLC